MEIKAKCKLDFEAVKAITYITMFRKGNPKKKMISLNILFGVLFIISILEIVVFGVDIILVLISFLTVFVILLNLYMWFLYPKVRYNALAKMKNAQNEYTFTAEKIFATTKSDKYNGQAEIDYALLVKVCETSKYFFLYQTNNQVYPVEKTTIEGGTVEEIRNKLSNFVGDKYIICKY